MPAKFGSYSQWCLYHLCYLVVLLILNFLNTYIWFTWMLALIYNWIMLVIEKKTTCLLNFKTWRTSIGSWSCQYGSTVSQKEVTGQGHPSQTNDITVSVVHSAKYWNGAHYPITRAWFERFQIHMLYLILCSILWFIHLTVIVYTSKL
jgi:hypothetical protein